ncbi:ABC transporter ATP-binding protein [Roseovarius sp. MBR-6]|jgi:branched-chain amino acid transport system ATP-binding protein|uniref:ABC transporter ATP-binding protein n=1 Tax=Roseovarius sp. MBR-6 TaxID=3156459 RepID=UPI00339AA504
MTTLLQARGMSRRFGGVQAVREMSLDVDRGSVTGLIGPNGAGKSTLFNLLSGVVRADAGEVRLNGQDVTRLAPWRRARLGMIRTFQLAREFQRMTVLENLMLAPQAQLGERLLPIFLRRGAVRAQEAEVYRRACEVMDIATLSHLRDDYAGDLSGGQKKLLELARALMIDCDLILLDEPGAGVNPALMNTLTDMIRRLNRDHGKSFLIVEHDMDMIAQLCDPVVVMTQGSLLTSGHFDDLRRDPAVIEAYLGRAADA